MIPRTLLTVCLQLTIMPRPGCIALAIPLEIVFVWKPTHRHYNGFRWINAIH